jgi:hypothetical protein
MEEEFHRGGDTEILAPVTRRVAHGAATWLALTVLSARRRGVTHRSDPGCCRQLPCEPTVFAKPDYAMTHVVNVLMLTADGSTRYEFYENTFWSTPAG